MHRKKSDNIDEKPETRRLLLAYPKSGTNMLRICTERLTGFKTPGNVTYDADNSSSLMAFARSHNVRKAEILPKNYSENNIDGLVLLLRDPKYAYLVGDIKNQVFGWKLEQYIDNIKYYSNFKKEKIVIYYEDLAISEKSYNKFLNFCFPMSDYQVNDFEEMNRYIKSEFLRKKPTLSGKTNNSPKTYSEELSNIVKLRLQEELTEEEIFLVERYL